MSDALIGQVIDEYRVDAELGVGGMGVVYKAQDTSLDRTVALKMLRPEFTKDALFMKRFRTEARSLARIHDPAIVTVFALRDGEAHTYIAMEYVEGRTFKEILTEDGPMPVAEAVPIFVQLLAALGRAHKAGVIHRDIKPANLMLSTDGQVKIMDFGLARLQTGELEMTKTSHSGGTPYYMPPEQFEGLKYVDNRSDLYALGMTLYQCLTGRLPMNATTMLALMREVSRGNYTPPHVHNPAIPEALSAVVLKSLSGDPNHRYASAEEMAAALEYALTDDTAPILRHVSLASQNGPLSQADPSVAIDQTVLGGAEAPAPPARKRSILKPVLTLLVLAGLGIGGWMGYPYLLAALESGPTPLVAEQTDPIPEVTTDPPAQTNTTLPQEGPDEEAEAPPVTRPPDDPVVEKDPPPTQPAGGTTTPTNPRTDPNPREADPPETEPDTPPVPVTATLRTNGFAIVNGERQGNGRSMQALTVPAGQDVTVECSRGGLSRTRTLSMAAGASRTVGCIYDYKVNIALVNEQGATRGNVLVDGKEAGLYQYPFAAGTHLITVQKADYELAAADLHGRRIAAQNGKLTLQFPPNFSDETHPERLVLLLKKQG